MRILVGGAAFLAGALDPGPRTAAAESPRLVLLYASCSVNADQLSPYDPGVEFTPHLDRFAREAVVFQRHHTEAGQSGTAFASLLSGTQADVHGVFRHPRRIPEGARLVTEAFAERGYDPFVFTSHPMVQPRFGYTQGVPPEQVFTVALEADDPRFARVLERLRDDPDYRALVVTSFSVTHTPYRRAPVRPFLASYPARRGDLGDGEIAGYQKLFLDDYRQWLWNYPETVRERGLGPPEARRLQRVVELRYQAGIHELDRRFGALVTRIRAAGLLDASLVAFTADHGEVLFRESALFQWTHGFQLAAEVLRVPLIVRLPGGQPGRYEAVTRSIDLLPTLLGLAGVPPLEDRAPVAGVDLAPAVSGSAPPPELLAYAHSTVLPGLVLEEWSRFALAHSLFPRADPELLWTFVRREDMAYKLRRFTDGRWGVEAFDLAADPGQAYDVYDPLRDEHREMAARLRAYKRRLLEAYRRGAGKVGSEARAPPDAERARALRALGYIE